MRNYKIIPPMSILILIVVLTTALKSQTSFQQVYQNIIPPSPNSSELGKYIEIPINYYTGTPDISIPLFEIIGKDIRIPISLSYHASGIKVGQSSTSVGLGWSLNAGGLITRSVRGIPDDCYQGFENWTPPFTKIGYLHNNVNLASFLSNDDYQAEIADYLSMGKLDAEPDMFYFHFVNRKGKFTFAKNAQVYFIPKNDYLITYSMEENSDITDFTIITEDGIKYLFDSYETTSDNLPLDVQFNSSWLLSKIETQKDTIIFTYEDETFFEESINSELFYIDDQGNTHKISKYSLIPVTEYNVKRISRIDWSGGYIIFGATNERQDVKQPDNNLKCRSIDELVVYNNLGTVIKKYVFDYDYFNNNCNVTPEKEYLCKRLKLQSIMEMGNSIALPPYNFQYNAESLPARNSFEQDYWGFYNANQATTFIPDIWAYPSDNNPAYLSHHSIFKRDQYVGVEYDLVNGADRSPDFLVIQGGILEKIEYPTGGYTKFEYEPHTFYFDGSNRIGGGIRIKKKIVANGEAFSTPLEEEYHYTLSENTAMSSGKIIRMPEFAYWRTNMLSVGEINSIDDMRKATFITTSSLAGLDETQGSNVAYSEVSVIQSGNGKVVRKFHLPGTADDIEDECQNDVCVYERTNAYPTFGMYKCWPNFPYGYYMPVFSFKLANYDKYPYAPNPNYDWNRGDIVEEIFYKESDFINPVKRITYEYEIKSYEKIPAIKCSYMGFLDGGPVNGICLQSYQFLGKDPPLYSYYDHYKFGQYYLLSAWKVLSSKSEYLFDGNQSIEEHTSYSYESPFHSQLTSITKTNSDLSENVKIFQYPLDIEDPNTVFTTVNEISYFNLKNMVNCILKTEEYHNITRINGAVIAYELNNNNENQILPYSIYGLDGNNFVKEDSFLYDVRGNLLQYHKENDSNNSYYWGYNNQYPIICATHLESSNLANAVNAIQNNMESFLENLGDLKEIGQRNLWNTFNNNLRASIPDAMISSYTYKPLVGMTSETDPAGKTTYYEYDDFNRLETTRDKEYNVIEHIDYNYISSIVVIPQMFDLDFYAGTGQVHVGTDNLNWNVSTDANWISILPPANGTGDDTFSFSYSENWEQGSRIGKITVSTSSPAFQTTITVNQISHPYLSVEPMSVEVGFSQQTEIPVDISSNTIWNVSTNNSWISINPTSGQFNGIFNIQCDQNWGEEPRVGSVNVVGNNVEPVTIGVFQDAHRRK